jgi:hypothetical protein
VFTPARAVNPAAGIDPAAAFKFQISEKPSFLRVFAQGMVGREIEQEPFAECVGAFVAFILVARLLVEIVPRPFSRPGDLRIVRRSSWLLVWVLMRAGHRPIAFHARIQTSLATQRFTADTQGQADLKSQI